VLLALTRAAFILQQSFDWFEEVHEQNKKKEEPHTRPGEEETETEDIYDDKQREEMLDDDEITAAENAFMQGSEMKPEKIKRPTHKDTVSVQLAEEEYEED
jgi:hypothetical protein